MFLVPEVKTMLTETFRSIITAARKVFTNWRAMLLLAIVYASLLAALYFFVAVREASIGQVILTFALAIAAPLLFFVLQGMVCQSDGRSERRFPAKTIARQFLEVDLDQSTAYRVGSSRRVLLAKAQKPLRGESKRAGQKSSQ